MVVFWLYHVTPYAIVWYCIISYGIAINHIVFRCMLWFLIFFCIGFVFLVLDGFALYYMILHGTAWYSLVLHDIVWYYIGSCGVV